MRIADLKPGWDVVTNDGHRLGRIKEVGQHFIEVPGGLFMGMLYVPSSAIGNIEHETVHLNIAHGEVDSMGWQQPPQVARRPPDRSGARRRPRDLTLRRTAFGWRLSEPCAGSVGSLRGSSGSSSPSTVSPSADAHGSLYCSSICLRACLALRRQRWGWLPGARVDHRAPRPSAHRPIPRRVLLLDAPAASGAPSAHGQGPQAGRRSADRPKSGMAEGPDRRSCASRVHRTAGRLGRQAASDLVSRRGIYRIYAWPAGPGVRPSDWPW